MKTFKAGQIYGINSVFYGIRFHEKIEINEILGNTVYYKILKIYPDDNRGVEEGSSRDFSIDSLFAQELKQIIGPTFK